MAVTWKKIAYSDNVVTKALLTEQGDVIYASGVGAPAALAHGTSGQALISGGHGANPAWGDVQASNASLAAIAAGTWTGAASITTLGTISTGTVPQANVSGLTTGSSPVFVTVKLSGLTDGYIPYHVSDATGLATTGLFWDGTNLGIGTPTPAYSCHVYSAANITNGFLIENTSSGSAAYAFMSLKTNARWWSLYFGSSASANPGNLAIRDETAGLDRLTIDTSGNTTIKGTGTFTGSIYRSVENGITASTTQTQAGGYALTKDISIITVCAHNNDAVTLPPAESGRVIFVVNLGANTLQIFPASGDDLGLGVNTPRNIISGITMHYCCGDSTNWRS